MSPNGIGAPAGDEVSSAEAEKRPEEIDGVVAPATLGTADEATVDEAEWASVPDQAASVAASEAADAAGPSAPADSNSDDAGEPAAAADAAGDMGEDNPGTSSVTLPPRGETEAADDVIGPVGSSAPDDDDDSDDKSEPGDDTPGCNSGGSDAADDEPVVPQFSPQALGSLLDETKGDLVALEDFEGTVNARAFENEWFGEHNDISREAFREELLRTGRYTAHIDEADNLLSDPEEFPLADDLKVRITLCVHRGWTENQKREFILRSQTGKRMLTYEQQRELKNSLIAVRLLLGVDYKTIGKMFGVHPNTVRNVEKRAAADPNSKLGITQPPDRRCGPETREKIAKAAELRKEGMADADIATILDEDVETVRKWRKDRPSRDKAKGGKKPKRRQAKSRMQLAGAFDDLADSDGVPERHRRALKHLGLDASAYDEWLKEADEKAQQDSNAAAGDLEASVKAELYFTQRAEVEKSRRRQILSSAAEAAVEEAPDDSSSDGTGPTQVGDILRGIVKSIKPDEVSVTLPVGRGVIDTRDEYFATGPKLREKVAFRFRLEGFDRKREAYKLKLLGQQTVAPAPGATAAKSDSDDRSSPYADLAGRKAGPKETGVTK